VTAERSPVARSRTTDTFEAGRLDGTHVVERVAESDGMRVKMHLVHRIILERRQKLERSSMHVVQTRSGGTKKLAGLSQ